MLNNKKIIHKNKQFRHYIVIKPLCQHMGVSISFAHPESKIQIQIQRGACELQFICLVWGRCPDVVKRISTYNA